MIEALCKVGILMIIKVPIFLRKDNYQLIKNVNYNYNPIFIKGKDNNSTVMT